MRRAGRCARIDRCRRVAGGMDDGARVVNRTPRRRRSARAAAAASRRGRRLGEAETAPARRADAVARIIGSTGFPAETETGGVETSGSRIVEDAEDAEDAAEDAAAAIRRRVQAHVEHRERTRARIAAERFPRAQDAFVARGEYRGGETRAVARFAASRVRDAGEREREHEAAAAAAAAAKDVGGGETRHRRRQASVSDQD